MCLVMSCKFLASLLLVTTSSAAVGTSPLTSLAAVPSDCHTTADCPPWFVCNATTSKCQCGSDLDGIMRCSDHTHLLENAILDCYCMTADEEHDGAVVVGACIFNCAVDRSNNTTKTRYGRDEVYHRMPLNRSLLVDAMCGKRLNRMGRSCGQCQDGYHPPSYSYDIACVNCTTSPLHWVAYISIAFLPLTIFYVFVLAFRINPLSPTLSSYVLFAQIIASPANARVVIEALKNHPSLQLTSKVVLAVYSIWNLDFFKTFSPPICLNLDEMQTLTLDYATAVYPLLLVVVTYMLMQLHARGCLLLNILWFPFKRCHSQLQSRVHTKVSVIDVFASFLILSYVKFLYTTYNFLVPVSVYDVHGNKVGVYLYCNANLDYFGSEHLPYGILAIFVTIFFLLLPMLLLVLYPMRCFQRVFGNSQALRIFIDSFQGSYKDGVAEGRRDYRYFSITFLAIRMLIIMTFALTLSGYFYVVVAVLLQTLILVTVVLKPYRTVLSHHLTLDVVFLSLLALWHISVVSIMLSTTKDMKSTGFSVFISGFIGSLPFFYILVLLLKKLWTSMLVKRLFLMVPICRRRGKRGSRLSASLLGSVVTQRDCEETCSPQPLVASSTNKGREYGSTKINS